MLKHRKNQTVNLKFWTQQKFHEKPLDFFVEKFLADKF